jgi:L-ascorbate metabolism protein UlaG (beta-lactamase superfamily)
MKLTWYGQSAFRVDVEGASILIDPFLSGNPLWKQGWEGPAEGVTHVLLTHGHNDHLGDSAAILKKTGAQLVANFEICMYLVGQGVSDKNINPGNTGGTVDCGGFTTTFVQALHSSSFNTGDGSNVYLGNPLGLVLHFPEDKTLYHMGDTDIFSDMALINELHEPKIGLVPVGDRFTMGGAVAALACRRFFRFETVVPCHYKTFGLLDQTPDKFVEGMEGSGSKVVAPEVGKAVEV